MTCEEFFQIFWPNDIPGRLAIWHGETKLTSYHTNIDAASKAARSLSRKKQNAFYGVALRRAGLPSYSRGGARDVTALPALFADIDVQSPAHKNIKLPPDTNTALQLALEIEPRPSLIIHSGGGLHVYHVLSEYIPVGDEWTIDRLGRLIRLYKDWLAAKFAPWYVDPGTFELSRVLRPAGTVRYKAEDVPTEVTPVYDDGNRISLESLLQAIGIPGCEANADLANIPAPDLDKISTRVQSRIESLLSHGLALQFQATWQHRRSDHPEWTQSEYDMAFAAHLARFEWPGEDIAQALVIYRKKWNGKPKQANYFSRTAAIALALVSGSPITIADPEQPMSLAQVSEALGIEIISLSQSGATLWIHLASGEGLRIPLDSLGTVEYLRQTVRLQIGIDPKPISDATWTAVSRSMKKTATLM